VRAAGQAVRRADQGEARPVGGQAKGAQPEGLFLDGGGRVGALWAGLLPRGFRIVGATIILQTVRSAALARIEGEE
jgi:hypothetical protein